MSTRPDQVYFFPAYVFCFSLCSIFVCTHFAFHCIYHFVSYFNLLFYKVAKNTSDEENNDCETQVVEETNDTMRPY